MSLSRGAKRLNVRKRATPATSELQAVTAEILPSNLPSAVLGMDPDLAKEFNAPTTQDTFQIPISNRDKDYIAEKSVRQRRSLPTLEIVDISFNIMSDDDIKTEAVFEVENKDDSGLFSVNDPRGGVVEQHSSCITCQKDYLECSGHLGMLKLHQAIVHPLMRKEALNVLISVCGSCGGLLVPEETLRDKGILNLVGSARLKEIAKMSVKIPCRRYSAIAEAGVSACLPNPTYKIDNGQIIYTRDEKSKNYNIMTTKEVKTILKSVSQEDAALLGFENDSHPRRFIMKYFPIIPLCARAPVVQDGMILPDGLTSMYLEIVRVNLKLAERNLPEDDQKKLLGDMIYKIEHLYNNTDGKYKAHKKDSYQSLQERIQGKEALIRKALMGKRVNYSARAVIGPDPTLKFGQIRVPRVMAPYLTQHEIVGPENIRKLTGLLRAGKITHFIPSSGKLQGRRILVNKKMKEQQTLQIGDEVDRWLENGDWVVYNRQPTLHKQGIMGYEVVLGEGLTTGLHLGYTKQHNAD